MTNSIYDTYIIGVDFDNTIVCYDKIFYEVAVNRKIVDSNFSFESKEQVRNHLREQGKETDWTILQGYVYGKCMPKVFPFPDVIDFFKTCKKKKIRTGITIEPHS